MLLKWVINLLILYAAWRWLVKPLVTKSGKNNALHQRDEPEGEYIDYEEVEDYEENGDRQ